jgi:hypothetical protein
MKLLIPAIALGYLFHGALSWSQVEGRPISTRRQLLVTVGSASVSLVASPVLAQEEFVPPVEVAVAGDAKKVRGRSEQGWLFEIWSGIYQLTSPFPSVKPIAVQ